MKISYAKGTDYRRGDGSLGKGLALKYTVYYLLIYFVEAAAWGLYTARVFPPRYGKAARLAVLSAIYATLFLVFRLDMVWLNVLGFLCGNLLFLLLCYRSKPLTALFHAGVSVALMSTCELIAYPFTLQDPADVHYFIEMILWAVLSKSLYTVTLVLLAHAVHEEENRSENSGGVVFLLICFPIISGIIMYILYMVSISYPISRQHGHLISVGAALLLFMNALVIGIYIYSRKRNKIFTEMQLSLQKEQNLSEYYQNMLRHDESQRILIHDIKNHLHTIALLTKKNAPEEVADYILQLTQSPALTYSACLSDNKLLNLILCQYQQRCIEKDIRFAADIQSHAVEFMGDQDITSLFCNLLDNAMEAAEKTTGGLIELTVKTQPASPYTVVTLINSCPDSPYLRDCRKLVSHKKNPSRHGYGMKSIGRVVAKYDGNTEMYFDPDSGTFHTVILLGNLN